MTPPDRPAPQPAPDLDALCEMLRAPYVTGSGPVDNVVGQQAADAITSLRERVAELTPFVSKAHEFQREAADLRVGKEAAEARVAELEAALNTKQEQIASYQGFVLYHADQIRGLMSALKPFADAVEQSLQTHKPVACFVNQSDWKAAQTAMSKMFECGFSLPLNGGTT